MKNPLILLSLGCLGLLAVPASRAQEKNPHDGYAFWLPNGTLTVGNAASEKPFAFTRTKTAPNGRGQTSTSDSFTVPLRKTRFDTPDQGNLVVVVEGGQNVVIQPDAPTGDGSARRIAARPLDNPIHTEALVFGVPRGPKTDSVSLTAVSRGAAPARYRFYFTDDADVWGMDRTQPYELPAAYAEGVSVFFRGGYAEARDYFTLAERQANTPEQARYARRFIRWCNAEQQLPKIARRNAKGFYDLGLYSMVNGFWELAETSFKAAAEADPKNPDAWYMLGDASSYVHSDLDGLSETVLPYYKKAADLYPRSNSNTYRNHLGLFHNLRVPGENGGTVVMHLTPEQIADTKRKWEFCTALLESASRGALRFENQWVEYDDEFDNTTPIGHDPAPFEGLWEPGTVDTFMKFTGWGASDAVGADCGPSRSADVNIGMREWDVLLHEWNHTLDWLMATSGLGIGVPTTHSSDWCGFQPISSMGMGHHSCNRYYMTPGMYRFIKGSDKPTTPWIDEWNLTSAALPAAASPYTEAEQNRLREAAGKMTMPLDVISIPVKAKDGYVDIAEAFKAKPGNYAAFAWTYVYSPADQKARCWIGADDNARVWVNDKLEYTGNYWSVCKFEEAREKDQIATMIPLRKGWNRVQMQISNVQRVKPSDNPPHPFWYGRPDVWGFSMRLCDIQNGPLPGVKWQARLPQGESAVTLTPAPLGKTYNWAEVKDDYTQDLPDLSLEDLRALTGYKNLTVTNEILFLPGGPSDTPRLHTGEANPAEVELNNELNWFFSPRETVAMLRYDAKDGKKRDLVFLRPEMYEAFMTLAKVSPEAKARGIKSHADQVIGYFTVPRDDSPNGRIVLALDTYLGDNPPVDEEDLLGFGS